MAKEMKFVMEALMLDGLNNLLQSHISKVVGFLGSKYNFCAEEALENIDVRIIDKKEKNNKEKNKKRDKEKKARDKEKKKRKNCEFNSTELVLALLLTEPNINDYKSLSPYLRNKELLSERLVFNKANDYDLYVRDAVGKDTVLDIFIRNFRANPFQSAEEVQTIYITGKNNSNNRFEEINTINKNISKKEAKADIYGKLISGEIVGFSVKQSSKATMSNFSVQKMLGPLVDKHMTNIRKKYLLDNGYAAFSKEKRNDINKLFYPQNKENIYWKELRKVIEDQKDSVKSQLVKSLFSHQVPYTMFEFDGQACYRLNHMPVALETVTFEDYAPYYKDVNGKERAAAKLFYQLCVGNSTYRVEVRWKGNIHNSSPQFLTFKSK